MKEYTVLHLFSDYILSFLCGRQSMRVNPVSATWSESGDVVLTVEISLPQKDISKPEAYRICKQIETLPYIRKPLGGGI